MASDFQSTAKRPVNGPRQYKPYPAYRDSDVEWLGRIPEHWKKKRLKFLAPFRTTKLNVETKKTTYVGLENIESWTGRLLLDSQLQSTQGSITRFHAGDVLFGKLRPYLAKAACPDFNGVSTSELLVFRPNGCLPRYLLYLFLNEQYVRWIDRLTYGTRMPRVGPEQVGDSLAPLPPLQEQRAIAEFLDMETGKIDALVAKKERLIELLYEKRSALITQAVTKGLDRDVPMRNSGIDWLGEIPEHWRVTRLRFTVTKCENGNWGSDPDGENDVVCIRVADFDRIAHRVNVISPTWRALDPSTLNSRRIRHHDLLLEKSGGGNNQPVGKVVRNTYRGTAICSNFIARMPVKEEFHAGHLTYLHASLYATRINTRSIKQNTGIQNLDSKSYLNERVALPAKSEQRTIAGFLDRETAKVDALAAKVRGTIERLKKLRTALISAAVTGKIDVREVVA